MSATPLTLTDYHRTLLMHVLEDSPGQYTWRIVVEEHCGDADADCTFEAPTPYASVVEAEAAAWAAGNDMLHGPRSTNAQRPA